MKNLQLFQLSVPATVARFYLMVAAVVVLCLLHQFAIAAVVGFAIAISAVLAVRFEEPRKTPVSRTSGQYRTIETRKKPGQAA